ncbi:MAG: hypothetical protein L3K07_02955, partial [Thermoplasmata archaeon]|nr:hypothetical protein [Thermoplasmata archaeon]
MVRSGATAISLSLISGLVVVVLLGSSGFGGLVHGGSSLTLPSPARSPTSAAAHASLEIQSAQRSLGIHAGAGSNGGYTWTNITAIVSGGPSPRIGAVMAWDAADGYVLLYGGENAHSTVVGDTWSYQNGSWTNLTATVSGTPPPLAVASLAYDPTSHRTILFSGITSGGVGPIEVTWAYHNRTWTNVTASAGTPPSPRVFEAMVTDTTDAQVLLFSGSLTGSAPWDHDTWSYKGGTWTNITGAAGYSFGNLLYPVGSDDPADHGVLAFALYIQGPGAASATLLYSSGVWRNVSATITHPSPLELYACAGYLASISSVVSYAGVALNRTANGVLYSTTAEYNASSWSNVSAFAAGPPDQRVLISCAIDGLDSSFLVFGGSVPGGSSGSSWLLSAPPRVTASANHLVSDQGTSVSFTGSVSEGAAPYTYHWSFGDGS